ncbi:MAG: Dipeptide-binding ABC transporter, periplasmic substrate-binding component [uncultured Thermomicrobiales bacterium]|uniref:Dipeptide-binding ABC transporter, periplasmic substrate-binding component n=1 Tax=uncultured Thermomicrobiales bacterium TaxID=1645740 RepID=A0A6J4UVS2_9BACT|nr:MAG: Dipeptide-binding ABC transporter, periplasmic substrate-binding component [uncultured Thermomicrobiales bacterium]
MNRPDGVTILQSSVALPDPHILSDAREGLNILAAVYDPLVRSTGPERFGPALAESWTLAPDARTWTFRLRAGVRFHDGAQLAAADVVATIERARSPELGGSYGTDGVFRSYVAGATVEAVDDQTMRIVTGEPSADLLDLLVALPIAPRGALDGLPDRAIGSGPFRVVEANGHEITMEAFAGGWHGEAGVRRLRWLAEPDHERRVDRLLAGEGDIATKVTPQGVRRLRDAPTARAVTASSTTCIIFLCNLHSGVCTDRRVRQALNHALDTPRLIDGLFDGAAERLHGPFTALHRAYDPASQPYTYDPALARKLLADAGYPDGIALTVDIPTTMPDEARDLARALTEQYPLAGIRVTIREHEDRIAYAYMVRDKRIGDLCLFDSSPPSTYRVLREKFHSGVRGPWWQGYANAEVDRLTDEARGIVDPEARARLFQRACTIARDDAPWVFLYAPHAAWGVSSRLDPWGPDPDGIIRFG